jgi:hypothetical protein
MNAAGNCEDIKANNIVNLIIDKSYTNIRAPGTCTQFSRSQDEYNSKNNLIGT